MPRDKATTYRIMSAVKSKNTVPERMLGRAMWKLGLRYRKHYKIQGNPDFVFVKIRVAIFCDGDFWHGHNWAIRGLNSLNEELESYTPFWRAKISRNVDRDVEVNTALEREGWLVMRFWESVIRESPEQCAEIVLEACHNIGK